MWFRDMTGVMPSVSVTDFVNDYKLNLALTVWHVLEHFDLVCSCLGYV
jgi:hypothetical protein